MKIAFNKTATFQFMHPTDEYPLFCQDDKGKDIKEKPMEYVIIGAHTRDFKYLARKIIASKSKASQKPDEEKTQADFEREEKDLIKHMSKMVVQFNNLEIETEDGPIDPENKIQVLSVGWMRDQIDESMADMSAFLAR